MFSLKLPALDAVVCILIFLAGAPFETIMEPNHRVFRLDNPAIGYPFVEHEQVPTWMLFVLSAGLPLGIITVLSFTNSRRRQSLLSAVLGFALAFSLNVFIIGVLKHWIGNQRPDFLARCIPAKGTPLNEYVGIEVCTTENITRLSEGYRSTPSGHTSHAFCGLLYLTLWLGGQLGTFRPGVSAAEMLASLTPLFIALYIGISRIVDYKHHWYDVILGGTFGILTAYTSYRLYFPPLNTSNSSIPVGDDVQLTETSPV